MTVVELWDSGTMFFALKNRIYYIIECLPFYKNHFPVFFYFLLTTANVKLQFGFEIDLEICFEA